MHRKILIIFAFSAFLLSLRLCGEASLSFYFRVTLLPRHFFRAMKHLDRRAFFLRPPFRSMLVRGRNEHTK